MSELQTQAAKFPKYLMEIDGEMKLLPLKESGIAYSSLYSKVEILNQVHEADGTIRRITENERQQIVDIADQVSAAGK